MLRMRPALRRAIDLLLESDSDEEFEDTRRPRFIRERCAHFEDLDDVDFVRRFRLSKRCALIVLELIEQKLEFESDKNFSVSPINQLLLTLRYYATGCTQISAGDFSGVSESTSHRIIHRVSSAIAELYRQFIYFPRNEREKQETVGAFYAIARFPRVIGAIDCTHIKIRSPGGEHAEYYRCRKGYFSLNCQAICNSNLEFMDLVARWPGSVHDVTIFDNSTQKGNFEAGLYGDSLLVGDGGYASKRYLMRPLSDPTTPEEQLYNQSQIRTRNPVERMFGVWKRRFPVLALGITVKLDKAMIIIVACAVLHNILRKNGDPQPPDDSALELPMPWDALIAYGQ
ncbi:hypothetical protein FOCC_FOCC007811 [Frankliniella occidentalis]|uniref:Putative nuclease HARBI1 n=1 Tax=Frankliniella occidentalis TaxID=133901 RepID=A0A9C6U7S2_FRAOC|nr:putative nuclease HARBI1 [Frankliniella occidentalis]KAE8745431.1 hypothetical protein FOCC_FOCC007811 [Frankliniella occidentalis]